MAHIYNGILLSHKKEWNFAICSNMDGEHYAYWNKSEKRMKWYHLYVKCKKYNKLVYITKKKQTHRYREQTSGYQLGERGGKEQYRGMGLRGTNYYV